MQRYNSTRQFRPPAEKSTERSFLNYSKNDSFEGGKAAPARGNRANLALQIATKNREKIATGIFRQGSMSRLKSRAEKSISKDRSEVQMPTSTQNFMGKTMGRKPLQTIISRNQF